MGRIEREMGCQRDPSSPSPHKCLLTPIRDSKCRPFDPFETLEPTIDWVSSPTPPMAHPSLTKSWFRHWLVWLVVAWLLAACGGRSDEDVIGPPSSADATADRESGASDATADTDVAETIDTDLGDASIDATRPDASADVRVDAIPDASVDVRVDAAPDARFDASDGSDGSVRVLVSISVVPPAATLLVGTKVTLTVTGLYSDATTADLTSSATFTTSSVGVAQVAGNIVSALSAGMATITARVNGLAATSAITVTPATLVSIAVTPPSATTGVNGTVAFTATGTLSDGSHQDLTTAVSWTSSNATVATVTPAGLARGFAAGVANVSATLGAVSGTATLTVTPATLVSIAVTPTAPVVGVRVTIPFQATGTYSDGSVADFTPTVTWSSSDPGTLAITSAAVGTTVAPGTSIVTASFGGILGTTTVTVTPATLLSIAVTPASSTLAVGGTTQLVATGTYSDMTAVDLTDSAAWSSSTPGAVFVSNTPGSNGFVTALAPGSAAITATLGGVSGAAKVTVTAATLVSIAIVPASPTVPLATTIPLAARGTYTDGSIIDVTTTVNWSVDDTAIATISNAAGTNGNVTGKTVGTTQVHADLGGIRGSATLTVTAATLVSIAITPSNTTVQVGTRQVMTATATFSDMTTADVTTTAVWTTGNTGVATVSNALGARGQLTATGAGTTSVTATVGAVSGSTNVTVTTPTASQLVVSPIAPTNRVGQNRQFAAILVFSNGTQQNVTALAMWSSSSTAVATINRTGLAMAVSVGTTAISAVYQGLSATTTFTVTNPVPVSITVTPFIASIAAGTTQQFQATAIYSDNTTQNVTNQATWTSTNTAVAPISTAGPTRGQARGLTAGTTTITATWQGLSDSTTLTVTAAVPVSISVAPSAITVAVGTVVPFTATLIYSDGTSRNVTPMATWTSSDNTVAQVTTGGGGGGGRGNATALSNGTTTISATFSGIVGTASLTVTSATLARIQITPFSPTLPVGFITPFTATGIYSDNSTRDLTQLATWVSTSAAVAGVSDAAATRGQVTPLTAGATTITATYQGVTGSDAVAVSTATLVSIAVVPASFTLAPGGAVQYSAKGTFSDASQMDVTAYVTWLSSDAAIADVSNAAASRGLARAFIPGTVTISATRLLVSGSTTLLVQ